jgi:hypothetical protein
VNEEEAQAEARRLNRELGAKGGRDARRYYYIDVRQPDGDWTVERRTGDPQERRWYDWIFDFFGELGP